MTVLNIHRGLILPNRGQPVIALPDSYQRTFGSIPFLSNWIDPGSNGFLTRPAYLDQFGGDTFYPGSTAFAPSYLSSFSAFGGRPGIDYRAITGIGLKNTVTPATVSYSFFAVVYVDPTNLPANGSYILRNNNAVGSGLNLRAGATQSMTFSPNLTGESFAVNVVTPTGVLSSGIHLIGLTYDDSTKRGNIYCDSIAPAGTGVATAGSNLGPDGTLNIGSPTTTANAAPLVYGDILLFSGSLAPYPGLISTIFTGMKARYPALTYH